MVEGVLAEIEAAEVVADRRALRRAMKAGAARNAIRLRALGSGGNEARQARLGARRPATAGPVVTCYTEPWHAAEHGRGGARKAAGMPLLKVKLGGDGDAERIRAVRAAAPRATLVVDANEAWSEANFAENLSACGKADVALIEQPLPAGADDFLRGARRSIPICADESAT